MNPGSFVILSFHFEVDCVQFGKGNLKQLEILDGILTLKQFWRLKSICNFPDHVDLVLGFKT